uniref:Ig-like domain-containing protein n=1 Tax=Pygocentrus nattereri TaxID=42514 RepID=A0A3B4DVZ5_PYGNA
PTVVICTINISSCLDGLKVIQSGENISITCASSNSYVTAIAWFKQTPGEKALLIASALDSTPQYHNDFDKSGRFIAAREQSSFTLNISNAEPSDSATYYCSVLVYYDPLLSSSLSVSAVLQPPVSDPVELGGDTTLQCSILTDVSAGEHSVYWFRHGSGESHPRIIYTHGNRSDECEKSSETDSPTQSCVYKLPKRILSLSDAGTYYCAVLMCGEIIFGNGTKLDFEGKNRYFQSPKTNTIDVDVDLRSVVCKSCSGKRRDNVRGRRIVSCAL